MLLAVYNHNGRFVAQLLQRVLGNASSKRALHGHIAASYCCIFLAWDILSTPDSEVLQCLPCHSLHLLISGDQVSINPDLLNQQSRMLLALYVFSCGGMLGFAKHAILSNDDTVDTVLLAYLQKVAESQSKSLLGRPLRGDIVNLILDIKRMRYTKCLLDTMVQGPESPRLNELLYPG